MFDEHLITLASVETYLVYPIILPLLYLYFIMHTDFAIFIKIYIIPV